MKKSFNKISFKVGNDTAAKKIITLITESKKPEIKIIKIKDFSQKLTKLKQVLDSNENIVVNVIKHIFLLIIQL